MLGRQKPLCQDNIINIQCISALRNQNKVKKESDSFPNYFLWILWKKKGVLSIISTF